MLRGTRNRRQDGRSVKNMGVEVIPVMEGGEQSNRGNNVYVSWKMILTPVMVHASRTAMLRFQWNSSWVPRVSYVV